MANYPVQEAESPETFGLRLELKVKNTVLIQARKELGLTRREAAKAIGMHPQTLGRYENMKTYPSLEIQRKICDFYTSQGISMVEQDVFPDELKFQTLNLSTVSPGELPPVEAVQETAAEKAELREMVKSSDSLNQRERNVLVMHYGLDGGEEISYEQLAEIFDVGETRIRQIAASAIRKLEHSYNSKLPEVFRESDLSIYIEKPEQDYIPDFDLLDDKWL